METKMRRQMKENKVRWTKNLILHEWSYSCFDQYTLFLKLLCVCIKYVDLGL